MSREDREFFNILAERIVLAMSALDDAIAANTAAVTENTTQVQALIAKVASPDTEPTAAQLAALAANTAQITTNNTSATAALNPTEAPAP